MSLLTKYTDYENVIIFMGFVIKRSSDNWICHTEQIESSWKIQFVR